MRLHPIKPTESGTRESSANAINQAMSRFPLIVEILDRLDRADIPQSGDDDIRHGCQRALTSMLAELSRIQPAPDGKISKAEKAALGQLYVQRADQLIDPDQLQRFQQFIDRILGARDQEGARLRSAP